MWEVHSASPSTGLSSGRGSSLGPFSEREQRVPGSHGHHLQCPVLQRPGQTRGLQQDDSGAEHSDPPGWDQGPRSVQAGTPPSSSHKEAKFRAGCLRTFSTHSLETGPMLVGPSFRVLGFSLGTWGRDKALSSCCDARSNTECQSAGM